MIIEFALCALLLLGTLASYHQLNKRSDDLDEQQRVCDERHKILNVIHEADKQFVANLVKEFMGQHDRTLGLPVTEQMACLNMLDFLSDVFLVEEVVDRESVLLYLNDFKHNYGFFSPQVILAQDQQAKEINRWP